MAILINAYRSYGNPSKAYGSPYESLVVPYVARGDTPETWPPRPRTLQKRCISLRLRRDGGGGAAALRRGPSGGFPDRKHCAQQRKGNVKQRMYTIYIYHSFPDPVSGTLPEKCWKSWKPWENMHFNVARTGDVKPL